MKLTALCLTFLAPIAFCAHGVQAQRPWQEITVPSVSEAAANFKSPPHEYGAIQPFQSWNGADPAEVRTRIARDLDRLSANGIFIINLSPGRRAPGEGKYLSPAHMDQVKFTAAELAKRNMRMWIQDESDYPSGFAGGYISERFPQLGMQDIVSDITVHVAPGQTLTMPIPADALAIWATETDQDGAIKQVIPIPIPADRQLKYLTPAEGTTPNEPRYTWQVQFLRHVYLSSPTRNFNRADGTRAKDATYTIIDYLDPKATDAFLHTVHDTYYGAVGDQFGKIVLGFFGDEPDYSSGIPWTPKLLDEFKAQKGYDLTPYLPSWFDRKPIPGSELARADYYDVWSSIFRDSFFGEQATWATKHNVEYLVHLNHEETMLALERSEGDYFRDNRHVEVPGIDNLSQLIPSLVHVPDGTWNINNNFPKLASSAAHLFGRPQVWAEEGGGVGGDGKYQMDFQFVRGVNALEIRVPILRFAQATDAAAPPPPAPPNAALTAWYANRGGYLMAIGRPAAQVALYHPGNTIWMGGEDAQEADRSTTKLGWQLFEHQVDWDYFDEQSLSSVATLENGGFRNLSGQLYKAVVFPSMTVITRTGLERLKAFAKAGGTVIFAGKTPRLILDKSFLDAKEVPDLSFATLIEPAGDITPAGPRRPPETRRRTRRRIPPPHLHPPRLARRRHVLLLQREQPRRIPHRHPRGPRQRPGLGHGHRRDPPPHRGLAPGRHRPGPPHPRPLRSQSHRRRPTPHPGQRPRTILHQRHHPCHPRPELDPRPQRPAPHHAAQILGRPRRPRLRRPRNLHRPIHAHSRPRRQTRLPRDRRRPRLRRSHPQRKTTHPPRLSALSLGRHWRNPPRPQRPQDRSHRHPRRSRPRSTTGSPRDRRSHSRPRSHHVTSRNSTRPRG